MSHGFETNSIGEPFLLDHSNAFFVMFDGDIAIDAESG